MLKTPREVCDLKAPKKKFKNDNARVEWLRDVKKIKFVKDHKGRLMVPWGEKVKMIQGNHHLVDETTAEEYATAQALVPGIRGGRDLKALLAMFDLWAIWRLLIQVHYYYAGHGGCMLKHPTQISTIHFCRVFIVAPDGQARPYLLFTLGLVLRMLCIFSWMFSALEFHFGLYFKSSKVSCLVSFAWPLSFVASLFGPVWRLIDLYSTGLPMLRP